MSVRGFCDAAYAIILDDHLKAGATLEEALTHLSDWAAGVGRSRQEREEAMIARRNTANLAALGIDVEGLFA